VKRIAVLVILVLVRPAHAWNSTGHKAIALIAYQSLSPAAKQRVDSLLSKQPDYLKWVGHATAAERGRVVFMEAAVWADAIRSDPRFHDDNQKSTGQIAGLPKGAQARHAGWHFMNLPFSADGTPTRPGEEPNILTKLKEFESFGTMSEGMQVYTLPWLLHLVGDVHQPLHVLSRFTKYQLEGDRGGNSVRTRTTQNLHSYWDSRIGTGESDQYLIEWARTIQRRHPRREPINSDPGAWVVQSFELRTQVYGFGGEGTEQNPAIFSDAYSVAAKNLALERAASAGYRLAEFLNERLR
jgi:hypothetical protein